MRDFSYINIKKTDSRSEHWNKDVINKLYYADNLSLILDIKIALKTIQKVIKKDGVNKDGMATTEKFNGHN